MTASALAVLGMAADSAEIIRDRTGAGRGGVVIDVTDTTALHDWSDVERALTQAFAALQDAKRRDVNLVVIVRTDDEFGRQGALPAMLACALTSAVRTLAIEARDLTMTANVVADDGENPGATLDTVCRLLESSAVTGQVVMLGRGHLGKVPV